MKKSKFTEEQIAFALHQVVTGVSVEEVCRKVGVSQATFYAWKNKYGGIGLSELRKKVSDYNSLGRLRPNTISPTRQGYNPCQNS